MADEERLRFLGSIPIVPIDEDDEVSTEESVDPSLFGASVDAHRGFA